MKNDILLQYLLSIEDLLLEESSEKGKISMFPGTLSEDSPVERSGGLLERAFLRVDDRRREKAETMRPGRGQAASLGAGLLLQLALGEMTDRNGFCGPGGTETERSFQRESVQEEPGRRKLSCYTAGQLLARLESMPRFSVSYRYGEKGKPYFMDYPFFFSLSHSGDYVFCVMSGRDLGADIQQWRKCDTERLAERFFSRQERDVLRQIRRDGGGDEEVELFFRLWARKEAYGKLTEKGIGDAAGVNLLPGKEDLPENGRLHWIEERDLPGYSMAVCWYE